MELSEGAAVTLWVAVAKQAAYDLRRKSPPVALDAWEYLRYLGLQPRYRAALLEERRRRDIVKQQETVENSGETA